MSQKIKKCLLPAAALWCFIFLASESWAQAKLLSVPDTTAKKGDTLLIPIRVQTLATSDSVYSGRLTFSYNANVMNVLGVDVTGTLMQGISNFAFNLTTRQLAFASSTILTGGGNFIFLKVMVLSSPSALSDSVRITSASFNEGTPAVSIDNGYFRILSMTVAPKIPSATLVVGDSVQFSVSGDQQNPLTWTSSNTSVATIDATGKLRAVGVGQLKVYVQDAQGLKDSTELFAINSATLRSLTLTAGSTSRTQTLTFNLPMTISDVSALNIFSTQFSLSFNSSLLQAIDVVTAGTMTASWAAPAFNIIGGRIDIAVAGSQALSGSGVLLYIRFRVANTAAGSTALTLSNVLFNENINANLTHGSFTALTAPTLVISPSAQTLTRGDTLRFTVTSGGTPPYTWTSNNTSIATINSSSGLLTAVGRGTTTVSVADSFGFTATSGSIIVNDVRATLPDTSVGLGNTIDIPLSVESLTGLGIYSYETRIAYDSTVVKFVGILTTGTMSSSFTVTYNDTLDTLRIAAAGSAALSGGGTLLNLQFTPASAAVIGNFSTLNFTRFRFNEIGTSTPTATTVNGRLSIGNLPPGAPIATAATSTTQTSFTANWNAVTGATGYRLDASSDNFTTFVTGYNNLTVTGTTQSVTGLTPGTTYSYRVRAVNTGGTSSNSNVIGVTTLPTAPAAPVAAAASNVTTSEFTANWNAVAGATSYQLDVTPDNFTTFVTGFNNLSVSGTSQNVTGLSAGTTYAYRVRAINAGGTSVNSNTISVTTSVLPPGAPTLNSPLDSAKGTPTTITLSWDALAGVFSYHLQVATDPAFTKIVADQVGLTGTSFSVTGLLNGTNYFWRVSASNAGGEGPFSGARIFTTAIAAPTVPILLSPNDTAKGVPTTLVLVWSKPAGATSYRLQISSDAAFSSIVFNDSTLTDTTKQVGPLANDSTYFWRVSAKNTGGTSAFSAIRSFRTIVAPPSAPALIAPSDGATGLSVSPFLQWTRVPSAISYRVQVSLNSSFSVVVFEDSTVADTVRQIGPLATSTTYFWRVSAKNSGGASPFSTSRSFTTLFGEPTLISPPNGATNITLTPTLSWTASSGATSYHLQLSTTSSFASIVTEDSAVSGTSKTVGPLAIGTTYFWRVRARNAGAASAFSSVGSFTTIAPPSAAPTLLSPAEGATNQPTTLTLIWSPSLNASSYQLQISTAPDFSLTVADQSGLTDTTFTVIGLQKTTLHFWRVKASNAAGASPFSSARQFTTGTATSVELTENGIPMTFYLSQNYPNPFNPSTTFEIHIANLGFVTLKIYNVLGNEVATIVNGDFVPGIYRVTWKADNLPSGMYFYRLNVLSRLSERWSFTKKLLLIK